MGGGGAELRVWEGWLERPYPGAGKVTSVAKVEEVLVPVPGASTFAHPPGAAGSYPEGALGEARSPGAAREHRPCGMPRRLGAPWERAGERGGPALPREGPSLSAPTGRGSRTSEAPPHSPGRAWPRSRVSCTRIPPPRAALRFLDEAAPDPCRLGSLSLPPPLLRTPEKFGPSAGAGSPALTPRRPEPKRQGGRGSRGRRRAAARARSSSQRPLLLRPPTELEKRRPPGCHLPALPPRRVTPRSTAPARRRQVPARGWREEPAARPGASAPPPPASAPRPSGRGGPLWGMSSGLWTVTFLFAHPCHPLRSSRGVTYIV